jgi:zinc and cadmium transporter
MFSIYLYSLTSVLIVSLVSLVGVFTLSLKEKLLQKYIFLLVSLATGALLGDAFIHLIPEAFESSSKPTLVSIYIIVGIIIFFILEKFLHWHHHQTENQIDLEEMHESLNESNTKHIHPVGKMILFSDGVHNFIDGLIIGVSYLVSVEVGIATTIAIILHEIPQEIGDFGVLIHSGYSKMKALWFNFLSALTAVLGTLIALFIGSSSEGIIAWLIPLAAGGFIYIAMSDLIPEMHKTKNAKSSFWQLAAVLIGVLAMVLLLAIE